jgi:2-phosphosulfolactate phosphatase
MPDPHGQQGFQVRFDWGPAGAEIIGQDAAIVAVVDVLSFTTSLTVAIDRGIDVFPYRFHDDSAAAYARTHDAVLALGRAEATKRGGVSLSPASIRRATGITRLVLPSPNGSTIAQRLSSLGATVIGVSLRNTDAAAAWTLNRLDRTPDAVVAVIASGERWRDGALRPALEDLWGAGAFIASLAARRALSLSPEARAATSAYERDADQLAELLPDCASGRELLANGYPEDVAAALELNASTNVPVLAGDRFIAEQPA